MLHLLDIFFVILHTSIIIFNLFGWIWNRTRKANLVLLLLTGFSWTILGIFYGFGYCPFTDWHWEILEKMGKTNLPSSYVEYLIARLLKIDISSETADTITGITYLAALLISILLNIKDYISKRKVKLWDYWGICMLFMFYLFLFFLFLFSFQYIWSFLFLLVKKNHPRLLIKIQGSGQNLFTA